MADICWEEQTGLGREVFLELRSYQEEKWQRLAGPFYKKMRESSEAAEGFLRHEDRNVRLAALGIITHVWRPGPDDPLATIVYTMAFEGDDLVMREEALCAFVECYRGTSDSRVGRILAEIAIDESQPASRREFAYHSLYTLQGKFTPPRPGLLATPPTSFRVPEDIDWTFVKSFLSEGPKTSSH